MLKDGYYYRKKGTEEITHKSVIRDGYYLFYGYEVGSVAVQFSDFQKLNKYLEENDFEEVIDEIKEDMKKLMPVVGKKYRDKRKDRITTPFIIEFVSNLDNGNIYIKYEGSGEEATYDKKGFFDKCEELPEEPTKPKCDNCNIELGVIACKNSSGTGQFCSHKCSEEPTDDCEPKNGGFAFSYKKQEPQVEERYDLSSVMDDLKLELSRKYSNPNHQEDLYDKAMSVVSVWEKTTDEEKGVEQAKEELRDYFCESLLDTNDVVTAMYHYRSLRDKTQNLLNALDEQNKTTQLNSNTHQQYTPVVDEHKPKSIWKDVSELPEDFNIIVEDKGGFYGLCFQNNKNFYIAGSHWAEREEDGSFTIHGKFTDKKEVKKACTLTDFINQHNSLEERVKKLEGK